MKSFVIAALVAIVAAETTTVADDAVANGRVADGGAPRAVCTPLSRVGDEGGGKDPGFILRRCWPMAAYNQAWP